MSKNHDIDSTRQVVMRARSAGLGVKPGLVLAILQELEKTRAKHRKEWGRAEAAEAAVQRVREVATAMATHSLPEAPRGGAWETAHGAQLFAKDILDALDGGEQE